MLVESILAGIIFESLLELFIDTRQFFSLRKLKYTPIVQKVIATQTEFVQMISYNSDRIIFSTIHRICTLFLSVLYISQNFYPRLFLFIQNIIPQKLHGNYLSQISFIIFYSIYSLVENLPFELISTFYIEAKHQFNKTTLTTFIMDKIKSLFLTAVIGSPICYICLQIIDLFPDNFYLYLFSTIMAFQLILVILFPVVIQPLFNKFTPLEQGSLKQKIDDLAKKIKFQASKILTMDGSTRSSHSNAYFIGLFKEKRIVLYDTLTKQCEENEILAILCHEFGHWYYSHTWKQILFASAQMFGYTYLFNLFVKQNNIFRSVLQCTELKNRMYEMPMVIKIIYFVFLLNFICPLQTLITNFITRKFERTADRYAVQMGYGEQLKAGLIKIHVKNKSNVLPDRIYSIFHHSHPTLFERISLIDEELKLKRD